MKNTQIILKIAASFMFLTFLGHTAGALKPVADTQGDMYTTYMLMKTTLVPMPIGAAKSYSDLMMGGSLCLSVFLFFVGTLFFSLSKQKNLIQQKNILVMNSLSALCIAILSTIYFFPVPALFTGMAGLLGLYSASITKN